MLAPQWMSRCSAKQTKIKLYLTVALVVRKRASWLILDTSGELFIISLTLEIGSEMFLLLADVWSSFSVVLPDIFKRAQRETELQVVLDCDAVLLLALNEITYNCCYVTSPSIDVESLLRPTRIQYVWRSVVVVFLQTYRGAQP